MDLIAFAASLFMFLIIKDLFFSYDSHMWATIICHAVTVTDF